MKIWCVGEFRRIETLGQNCLHGNCEKCAECLSNLEIDTVFSFPPSLVH